LFHRQNNFGRIGNTEGIIGVRSSHFTFETVVMEERLRPDLS